ncbi:GNAT family N-acetyltransferase [Asaia bogorensis]|uniref:GNAT family N-acetyltransferase n=1 Tax=Asaia bogorensis TaxID=91915 RepID=UPI0028617045|nr:GNAT family N-acetyltransferase [Asaia bogorensis]MDR6183638.1 ribosomal-protein-alanine N-acetyltransferase [Asaia bogorensis NBRC 16594]
MTDGDPMVMLGTAHGELCAALHRDAFPEPEQWTAEAFTGLLSMPGVAGWVYTDHSGPTGLLLVRHCMDEAEILTVAVLPAFRRKGVASALIEGSLTFLAGQGVTSLFLEVSVNNSPASALYLALGFEDCGIRRSYYPDGSDARVMRHDLHSAIR